LKILQKTIILPNGAVSNGTIVNYSKNGYLRGNVDLIVSASNDIDKVKELLFEAISKHYLIISDPKPEIFAVKIVDNAVTLSVKAYSKSENMSQVNSDIVEIAKKVFQQNKIDAPVQMRMIQTI
jgi:small conductance mechanosensitive channel